MAASLVDALVCDVKTANLVDGVEKCKSSVVMKSLYTHLRPLFLLDPHVGGPIEPS